MKRGLAITPVKFGISFTAAFFNQAGALVLVYKRRQRAGEPRRHRDGAGAAHQDAADRRRRASACALDRVRIMPTRTDKVPNTSATAASGGSDLNGAAVKAACDELRARLAKVASRMVSAPAEDLVFADGRIFPDGEPEHSVAFDAVVARAYLDRVQLFATGYYRTPRIFYDTARGEGKPFHYYAWGAAVSEVEVDGFTGMYTLRRVDILHDVGDSISPLVDRGQIEGGFVQGMGWLTLEELVWAKDGRLATRGASTYKLPSLGECPEDFRVRMLPKAAAPGVVHGSKAVGEPPLMLAMSVREALRQAVAAFGTRGARADVPLGCPATPEAVFWAIEHRRAEAAAEPATAAAE